MSINQMKSVDFTVLPVGRKVYWHEYQSSDGEPKICSGEVLSIAYHIFGPIDLNWVLLILRDDDHTATSRRADDVAWVEPSASNNDLP